MSRGLPGEGVVLAVPAVARWGARMWKGGGREGGGKGGWMTGPEGGGRWGNCRPSSTKDVAEGPGKGEGREEMGVARDGGCNIPPRGTRR